MAKPLKLVSSKQLKVLVSASDYPKCGLRILQNHFTVLQSRFLNFGDSLKQNREELLSLIPGCSALIWMYVTPITEELLDAAGPQLRIVSAMSDGYEHCNGAALRERCVMLSNAARVQGASVAESAIGLMLAAARRYNENTEKVRSAQWDLGFETDLGMEIRGSTVGIVGLGDIGQAVVKRLAGFEVERVVYTGRAKKGEDSALGAEYVSLDELLSDSDFVVLCVPLTDRTHHIINSTTLAKMKRNAIIVNVGRGRLIDQDALYEVLKYKHIFGAALDVTTPEPLPKDHRLLTLPNLFVTPHVSSATQRTRRQMAVLAANNVVNALYGKPLITPVQL